MHVRKRNRNLRYMYITQLLCLSVQQGERGGGVISEAVVYSIVFPFYQREKPLTVNWHIMVLFRSNWAVKGPDCTVNEEVERVIKEFHSLKKPIA